MIVSKDFDGPTEVALCDRRAGTAYCECPWGNYWAATLYVNGFPAKRVLRKSKRALIAQLNAWMADSLTEWGAA